MVLIVGPGCQSRKAQSTQLAVVKVVMRKYTIEPATIHLKQGKPVTLEVSSGDVQHGFYVQALKIDEPIQPGKPATIKITPSQKGEFRMECDIICGPHHEEMQGTIIVE